MHKFKKKTQTLITAVRLKLDTPGLTYEKWGGTQQCKAGDWIVDNAGEVYSIDAESFAKTYREASPGRYIKHVGVWAVRADKAGTLRTKEGTSDYAAGDMLVYNNEDGTDGYPVAWAAFHEMYERV